MSSEKMKILEMIEKQLITPEEGLKLLEAIDKIDNSRLVTEPIEEPPVVETPPIKRVLTEEEFEEALEEASGELEELAGEVEEEVEDLIEEIEDAFEDITDEMNIEEELEEQLQAKVDELKHKAGEIRDRFLKEFDLGEDNLKANFSTDEFKSDMNNWKNSFKYEIKSLNKEAKRFGKEMSRLGKETAKLTQDIVAGVMDNLDEVIPDQFGKEFSEEDFIMDQDHDTRNYNLEQEFSINIDGKTDIAINVVSTDVTIVTEDRDDLLVNYIKYNPKDKDRYKVVVEEDSKKLRISEKKQGGNAGFLFNFSGSGKKLLIRLPHKYKESISVNTVSGDLDINYLDSDFFKFSSVSGDMSADIIYSVNSLIKTTSGDCAIQLFRGNMMYSTVSGDIEMTYEVLDGDFTMKAVSGDAKLNLPKNSEFEVVAKTMSGILKCDFPITYVGHKKKGRLRGQVGSDAYTLSASTTSGDLIISKY